MSSNETVKDVLDEIEMDIETGDIRLYSDFGYEMWRNVRHRLEEAVKRERR